jgi:hypothetical protein
MSGDTLDGKLTAAAHERTLIRFTSQKPILRRFTESTSINRYSCILAYTREMKQ